MKQAMPTQKTITILILQQELHVLYCLTFKSGSSNEREELTTSWSKGPPVILRGPLGIRRTVNLNCATNSPIEFIKDRD